MLLTFTPAVGIIPIDTIRIGCRYSAIFGFAFGPENFAGQDDFLLAFLYNSDPHVLNDLLTVFIAFYQLHAHLRILQLPAARPDAQFGESGEQSFAVYARLLAVPGRPSQEVDETAHKSGPMPSCGYAPVSPRLLARGNFGRIRRVHLYRQAGILIDIRGCDDPRHPFRHNNQHFGAFILFVPETGIRPDDPWAVNGIILPALTGIFKHSKEILDERFLEALDHLLIIGLFSVTQNLPVFPQGHGGKTELFQ